MQIYEEKIATMSERRYNENNPVGWKLLTRNYWVGRVPDMQVLLRWIEEHSDE